MRKLISVILTLCLAASLAACAGNNTESGSTAVASGQSSESSVSETSSESSVSSAVSETSSTGETATGDVLTYDEYMAAELDTEVTIEAYVQAKQS